MVRLRVCQLLLSHNRDRIIRPLQPCLMFSTPVRGSVDAGQPDSIDTRSSIRNLVAVQEKQNRVAYQIDYMTGGKVNSIQANPLEKGIADHKRSQKRPNINVTTNPLDISLISAAQPCNTQGCNVQGGTSTKSRGRSAGESLDDLLVLCESITLIHSFLVSLLENATFGEVRNRNARSSHRW